LRSEEHVPGIKIGALCWNQYTTWPSLLEAGRRADTLGYDTLSTWGQTGPKQVGGRGGGVPGK
jgi:hypothetical protein